MIVGNKNILPSRYTVIWRRIVTVCTLLVITIGSLSLVNTSNVVASPVVALPTNHLMLNVVDASNSSTIADYKYLINVDNTGNPLQARNDGCSPENPGYPDSCDWPSIRAVPGAAPIYTQGNQADFISGLNLPDGKYLISVLADGYKMGGIHFTVPLEDPGILNIGLQPHPLPAATMRIKVFEDDASTNGQMDTSEHGLAGFRAVINDTLGQISTDVFGNPLCTTYDVNGDPTGINEDGCLISDANGDMVIPNLGPLRYDVLVNRPTGTNWMETTTLEGSPSWDTWLQEGGTGLDNEFVVAGEPFPWTIFGFVNPEDSLNSSATGGISGTLVSASVYLPQTGALPYFGDIWSGFTGTKVNGPITDGWIALSDLQNGDQAVYVQPANPDGTFTINNVPDGNYLFTWWDTNLNYILDWIQVTVSDGQMTDLGTPMLTGWFTKVDGYVFNDINSNGKRDPGEAGIPDYLVVLKDRENSEIDRMSISAVTDQNGYYVFEKAYPMGSWMILEAYADRYYTTGVTYQVENQPEETTVLGAGVDVGLLPILGQSGRLDWGVKAYSPGTNGGIVGTVFYDVTRNELDPQYQAVEPWASGIPNLLVVVSKPVFCGTHPATPCDPTDTYELAPDGSLAKDMTAGGVACGTNVGTICDPSGAWELDINGNFAVGSHISSAITETWEQPTGCTARDAHGNELTYPDDQQLLPTTAGERCLEAPLMGTQFQEGFASLDGNYGFDTVYSGFGSAAEPTGTAIPAGDYLVEVLVPNDALGRPTYQVVREEDINIFGGDEFVPAVPPPACVGPLHTVDVAGVVPDGPNAVVNAPFADAGGSVYEGMDKPLCNVKLVTLNNGKSIAPSFTYFTDVPIPGKWKGYIIDDLSISVNPLDLMYGEKAGAPLMPIGIYDFTNRMVASMVSDPNGVFEILLPSTHSVNCPSPSGVCPNVYYMLGNDPSLAGYNPQYRTIGASFEIYSGLLIPSDLAPTQIVPGVLAAGSLFSSPPQCGLDWATPQLFKVTQPHGAVGSSFTITGAGFGTQGPDSAVTLDGTPLSVSDWNNASITVTIPASVTAGPHQLAIHADNGKTSVNGLTFHVTNGSTYNPLFFNVGPSQTYSTIQSAMDAAAAASSSQPRIVVVYPATSGIYYENVIMYDEIKLQGVGPGGSYENGPAVFGSTIDGRGVSGDSQYAEDWRVFIASLPWSGNQAIYEGAVVYVVAEDGEFDNTFPASIDGFTIQGGDQQGFPNQLVPNTDPSVHEIAAVQGGGIFVNGYARYMQITNNLIQSNGGAYASAIRLGTPNLPGVFNDSQNDFMRIANNRILANGGTNLAGAVGIFSGTEGYEVANNDICGNFSAEYGGGISHYGMSPDGAIHHNRVYFNRSYDEGGGIFIAGELPADPDLLSPGAGPVDVYANLIQNNLGNDDGGGLRLLMAGNFEYNIYNNIIVNNISTHEGGGVSLNDAPNVRFFNNTVMKNITTATAMTSNGQPAPAGLSSSRNSNLLQATLPIGSPIFSDPLVFNNIFWDNRSGTFVGSTVAGIGLVGDPNPVNNWDLGVSDGTGDLSPTNSIMQTTLGTFSDPSNQIVDPSVISTYDTSVRALPWRGNPRFVDILMITTDATPNLLGDYRIPDTSPAVNAGAASKAGVNAPADDFDGTLRPSAGGFEVGADEIPVPMVVSSVRLDANPTSLATVSFSVTFSESVTGVDTTDFSLTNTGSISGASVASVSGSGLTRTVSVNTGTGEGTIRLDVIDNDSIQGLTGTPLGGIGAGNGGFTAGEDYTIDRTSPTVISSTRLGSNPSTLSTVSFLVTFSEAVTGVDSTDFALTNTGTIAGASISGVTGSGATRTVNVSTGTGSGTIRLDIVDDDSISDAASNFLGGTGAGNGSFTTGEDYTIDKTPPSVVSSTRNNPSPTALSTVSFLVTFSESVTGVDSADFTLTNTGSIAGASVGSVTGSGATRTVNVNTGTGSGTIRLNVADNDSIVDALGLPLGGTGAGNGSFTAGQIYTIDRSFPTVSSSIRLDSNPTSLGTVSFLVTFSESVTGVDAADFNLTTTGVTGTSVGSVTGSGATRTITVNTGTGNTGTVRLNVVDNDSILDDTGNLLGGTGAGNGNFTTGQSYIIDRTPPMVVASTRVNANPTALSTVFFTVTFSETVTGVGSADFTLTTTGTISGASVGTVIGLGPIRLVGVNTGTGNGTIRLNVSDDNSILDGAGNSLGGPAVGDGNFNTGAFYTVIRPIAFADVSETYWAKSYIESLYYAGITSGCGLDPSVVFCPDSVVTRAQMAVFLLRSIHGPSYIPPEVDGSTGFNDVPVDHSVAAWIKQLAAEGITGGCGSGNYCPDATVTRDQMAVFLLRAKYTSAYIPPSATGVFTDVPVDYWAAPWIEQLASEGITGGCGIGNYCPNGPVTRSQMAVFLVRTFDLP